MGSSRPSSPTYKIKIPEAPDPTVYQALIPEGDFARATDYINDLRKERNLAKAERYQEIGIPEEIGQRVKEREARTAASYLASLPEPEIDYTDGIEPDVMNKVDLFLADLDHTKNDPYNQMRNKQLLKENLVNAPGLSNKA